MRRSRQIPAAGGAAARLRALAARGRALALLLALAAVAAGCSPGEAPVPPEAAEPEAWEGYGSQTVVLFFAEGGLEPVWREELRVIELHTDPADRIERALEELFRGPEQGRGRAWPPGARLAHVFIEDRGGLLTLDFHPATVGLLTRAGSLEERLALESLERTLRVNFPALRAVRILVGGEPAASLGGHLSTARPLRLATERRTAEDT